MGPYAFIQAFLSGFFAFAAVSALALWWGVRRDRSLLILTFICAVGSVQAYSLLALASAETIDAAQFAVRLRVLCGVLMVAALTWLFSRIAGVRARWFVWTVTITMAAVAVIVLISTTPLLGGLIVGVERTVLPWGEPIATLERLPARPGTALVYVVITASIGFNIYCARRFMAEDRVGGILLTIAAFGSLLTLVSGLITDLLAWRYPYFGSAGIVATTVVIALQLVEERRRQVRLAEAEGRFRAIFDQTFQMIGVLDGDGTLLEINRTALEFAGARADDVVGKPIWDTPWWNHSPDLQARLRDAVAVAAHGRIVQFEATHRAADGRLRRMDVSIKPAAEAGGVTGQLISESRDIEERAAAEESKQQLEQRLAQGQKIEALGQLAGGVAHDFNNLLTVIAGHTDLALEDGAGESLRADLVQIREAARQAASMTTQLLAFSRQSVSEPEVVSVNAVIGDLELLIRRTIGEHIELSVQLDPAVPSIRVDRQQFSRVLLNLAVNARDAMPGGGTLTIATECRDPSHVRVVVRDTGAGMSEDVQTRLFEPFFTTKPLGQGTGLGLAVVDGIVKQAGGAVSVESAPGHGSAFRIDLPAVHDAPASLAAGEPPAQPRGSETILLVEDNPAVRKFSQRALERHGYRVVSAANGDEALGAARAARFDLLITDVVMPNMSGPQLVERLMAEWPALPVLFVSGYAPEAVLTREQVDRAAFLQKPYTPTTLVARVRAVLDSRS